MIFMTTDNGQAQPQRGRDGRLTGPRMCHAYFLDVPCLLFRCAMPTLLRLRLIPQQNCALHLGNAPAHGWFHALAAGIDPDWQRRLHQANGVRAVALSPLCSGTPPPLADEADVPLSPLLSDRITAGQPLALRVAFLDDEQARLFCLRLPTAPIPRLGAAPCLLARVPHLHPQDPDVVCVSWAQLADAPPARRLHLHFLTPTFFAHQGEMRLLPDPEQLWQGWLRAWQTHAPALPLGTDTLTLDGLRISHYQLHTEAFTLKRGLWRGFLGEMALEWHKDVPPETRRAAAALAGIADFAGTGAKTMLGLGQTRFTVEDGG